MLRQHFIEPEVRINLDEANPPSYIRRVFALDQKISKAELHITACGLYRAFINGQAVTDAVFMPGFTYYHKRLQRQVYDVTALLRDGTNVTGVILGDGWYRGQVGGTGTTNFYGEKTKLAAVLELTFADGTLDRIVTDPRWKATQEGPIRKSWWKDGDIVDARKELVGWLEPAFDDHEWLAVIPGSYEGVLVPSEGEPILEHERFTPEILTTPDGATVLDFGQNLFGYVEFTVTGQAGHTITLAHGETLDEHGNFTLKNVSMTIPLILDASTRQEVTYTLKDGTQTYKPLFSAFGFRYVRVDNWPEEVRPDNFTAIAVYSAMNETGTFECSIDEINQLVHNTRWSQKGNFLDIPTDCPTRERAGWTGDIAAFCEAGSYLMDTNKFLTKWLKDLALQQREDGQVPNIIPDVGMPKFIDGSAGWGDAAVIVPYLLYMFYGNRQVLEDQYESMVGWLDFVQNRARNTHWLNALKANPYKDYIVDTGWHWGEWLEPGRSLPAIGLQNLLIPDAEVATAYFAYSAGLLSAVAGILGKPDDEHRYRELSDKIKEAYRYTFTDEGLIKSNRMCRYIRPVALDILPEVDKARNIERLNRLVMDNDYKIGTGFLTTPFVLNVLTDYGYTETAYRMAQNKQHPGWLYPISKGATTIWESWNGIDENGKPDLSLNHYSYGAVVAWFYSRVAGIRPLQPGFEQVQIRPYPGGMMTYAKATFQSVQGLIESSWMLEDDTFTLEVTVPPNTTATVHLPDGSEPLKVGPGTFSYICSWEVQ